MQILDLNQYWLLDMQLIYHRSDSRKLPRCAAPVASNLVRYEIQHTYCLLACGLLDHTSRFLCFSLNEAHNLWYCYIAFRCCVRLYSFPSHIPTKLVCMTSTFCRMLHRPPLSGRLSVSHRKKLGLVLVVIFCAILLTPCRQAYAGYYR